jgi:hypothetical protein
MRWDKCNKWLYIGEHFILQFDCWDWMAGIPTIRQWSLFQIMYDNGAFWADLDRSEESYAEMDGDKLVRKKLDIWSGAYPCFIRVTILGIGFQFDFKRRTTVINSRLTPEEVINEY